MQAAITLAGRGHEVTLVEKADKLGGNLHPAGAAYFKRDIAKFCQVLINRVHKAGVRVVLNTEVTPAYVREAAPDVLFVAIGSEETLPPIPGIRGENVVMAIDAELHPEKLGKKVVIMGGGLVGSEAAVAFHAEGRECSIIEMKDEVAGDVNMLYRGGLMPEIEKAAAIYTNTVVKESYGQRRDGRAGGRAVYHRRGFRGLRPGVFILPGTGWTPCATRSWNPILWATAIRWPRSLRRSTMRSTRR